MDCVNHGQNIESEIDSESNSIDKSLREQTTVTAIGKTKTFARLDREEWIFITISLVNVIITVAFTIKTMTMLMSNSPDFTFAVILLINVAFCIFYAIHGVLREREFEIYAYIAAITVVFTYIIINMATNSITDIKWARFATILVFAPFNIYYGIIVSRGFGFLEYKTVGAAVTLQKMYRKAGIFSCLLKFDFQLALSLAVLLINNPQSMNLANKIILGTGVPFQFFWSFLGWIMMRREIKYLALLFVPASLVEPGYIIYQLEVDIRNWAADTNGTSTANVTNNIMSTSSSTDKDKDTLIYCFIVVAGIALLVRLLVLIALKFVVENFRKGLRESVYNLPVANDQPPLLPRKRDFAKCCGIVCCGPLG